MATITRFVNPASAAGGDGTTSSTSGANRAYSSANEWEANEQTDLVADGDVHVVNCAGSTADTTRVLISGWTTGASNFITVKGETQTQTPIDNSKYRIQMTGDGFDGLFQSNQNNTIVEDLQVDMTTGASQPRCYEMAGDDNEVHRCKATMSEGATPTGYFLMGFFFAGNSGGRVTSSLAWDFVGGDTNDAGFGQINADATSYVELWNCTAQNCHRGYFLSTSDAEPKNCLDQDGVNGYAGSNLNGTPEGNCSDQIGYFNVGQDETGEVTFVDEANDDFQLSVNDNFAYGRGVDLSAFFNYDLFNNARTRWSIGCLDGEIDGTLAELLLDADGTIVTADIVHDAGTGTPYFTHNNDQPDGVSTDFVRNSDTADIDGTFVAWFSLSDVDADFSEMISLRFELDVQAVGFVNDECDITARIFDADNDTTNPLCDETPVMFDETDTTRSQKIEALKNLAGSKAQWDAAHIRFSWIYNRVTSGDNASLRIFGCDLNGYYISAAATDLIEPPLLHSQAVSRAANY